jgi:hypothetical protein
MTNDQISWWALAVAAVLALVNLSGVFIRNKSERTHRILLGVLVGALLADIVAFVFDPSWFLGGLAVATALLVLLDTIRLVALRDAPEPEDEVTA